MIIIGEKINATRKAIGAAIAARDEAAIVAAAVEQARAGAHYLDINGGDPRPGQEARNMAWLLEHVQANTDLPVCIDTADPEAAATGLKMVRAKPIINSVSLEVARLGPMLPLVSENECMVIALLMSDAGTPSGVDDRLRRAEELIGNLLAAGKRMDEIIIDPCFLPVSTDAQNGPAVIDAIAAIRRNWPEVHVGGGLSNISFGLPRRRLINLAALCQAVYQGMDVAIIDPCVPGTVGTLLAAEAVAGRDEFCMNYVMAEREGKLA